MYTENQIDQVAGKRLTTKRCGDDDSNGKVLARVDERLNAGFPLSISIFERSYLELVESEVIQPFKEKLAVAAPPAAHVPLTAKEYHAMRASDIARRYMRDTQPGGFRDQVDELIKRREI